MANSKHEEMIKLLQRPLLTSKDEIMTAYGISSIIFDTLITLGMPATKINGRYYAHPPNINRFFEKKLGPGVVNPKDIISTEED